MVGNDLNGGVLGPKTEVRPFAPPFWIPASLE